MLNVRGRRVKLPVGHALGTLVPLSKTIENLEARDELEREAIKQWLDALQSSERAPLASKNKLDFGTLDDDDKALLTQLLRYYTMLLEPRDSCPPAMTTGVHHHIHTGDAAPILQRRFRNSERENMLIAEYVAKMLMNGVIEVGHGA